MTKKELAHWRRRRTRIRALMDRGRTQSSIARELRISKQRVSQLVRELNGG